MASSTEPFLYKTAQEASSEIPSRAGLGKPCHIHRFSLMDLGAVGVAMAAFVIAMVAAFHKGTAVYLGQTSQLIVLGLMLAFMGACTQRQVQRLLFVYEARSGSTLQNFDALLRADYLSQTAAVRPRAILLLLFLLPLGLGASYKRFIGGSTTVKVPSLGGWYGLTAAPGYQRIGNGLSLLVGIYLPFWIDPTRTNGTYGFNLLVPSSTTAAILDAPLPTNLLQLQASLKGDESLQLSAEVNAIVSEINPITPSERSNAMFWQDLEADYHEHGSATDLLSGAFSEMWAGSGDTNQNFTEIYVAYFNTTREETFNSTAVRYVQTRRSCLATWNITRTNILLSNANILETAEEAKAAEFQGLLLHNAIDMFSPFLGEYAPTIREAFHDPLPFSNDTKLQYSPTVNTVTPLVAAMLWARIVSAYGMERRNSAYLSEVTTSDVKTSDVQYWRGPDQITTYKIVVTVERSFWLIFILAIHLVLTAIAVLIKALLYTTPIGDGFGLVSLLSGIKQESLDVLRGAALSGELREPVKVRFLTRSVEGLEYERLEMDLDSQGRSDSLDPRNIYG